MISIGRKIINGEMLPLKEANQVCCDLKRLDNTGVWIEYKDGDIPAWVTELARHYRVNEANYVVQLAGWKAVAMAYRDRPMKYEPWNDVGT